MRNYLSLLICCILSANLHAQYNWSPTLHIGDAAPPLRLGEWIKGKPFQQFEKGQVYVLEFWATWCAPCRAAMPRLSALARQYRDKVTFVGVDILENRKPSTAKIKRFVDSMGDRMDYAVAIADGYLMESGWYDASGRNGIPATFVVNAEGRVAWIGHPAKLDDVLPKILNNTWDIQEASAKRKKAWYLDSLDRETYYQLIHYYKKGQMDSALLEIDAIVKNQPELKYAPSLGRQTFAALLKTDPEKAYAYAKALMVTPTYSEPDLYIISDVIKDYANELNIPPHLYQLGAEACEKQINEIAYPEIVEMHKRYSRMAEWYSRANDKSKAIDAQEKAIAALQSKKNFSATELTTMEARLQQYRNL
jgi:thiol-disulfide isomerase/thioredoxin